MPRSASERGHRLRRTSRWHLKLEPSCRRPTIVHMEPVSNPARWNLVLLAPQVRSARQATGGHRVARMNRKPRSEWIGPRRYAGAGSWWNVERRISHVGVGLRLLLMDPAGDFKEGAPACQQKSLCRPVHGGVSVAAARQTVILSAWIRIPYSAPIL